MLQATDICKGYGERLVLDQVSLSFADTGLVCILGRSGCGKTTLLNILGGLEGDFEGELEIDGRSRGTFSRRTGTGTGDKTSASCSKTRLSSAI